MAGRGPSPKKQNQRGTSNYERLAPLTKPVLPALSVAEGKRATGRHTPLALAYWDSWRQDPVTATWTPTEIVAALHLIELIDADPIRHAGEIRIRLDSLALTPKGRRDARLLLPEEDDPEAGQPQAPTPLRVLPEAK